MPSIKSPAKVLVTGANGFIATWIVQLLIDRGYSVVGTVRTVPKGTFMKQQFGDKFEFAIVSGLWVDAFDEVVKTVNPDVIIHTATPITLDVSGEPDSAIQLAVQGTVGILQSAQRFGSNVKRVVITSSVASLLESKDVPSYTFTENDWNLESEQIIEREGKKTSAMHRYRASKKKAEEAAWKFVNENKNLHFDLVTILPSVVFGPILHDVKDVSSLNVTIAVFHHAIVNHILPKEFSNNCVDVRDVALAHILAFETSKAGGERIIVSSRPFFWHQFTDALIQAGYKVLPHDQPKNTSASTSAVVFDNSKSKEVLGIKYHDFQKTAVDTYAELKRRFPESFP